MANAHRRLEGSWGGVIVRSDERACGDIARCIDHRTFLSRFAPSRPILT